MQFPESQTIIDAELLREKNEETNNVNDANVAGGISEDLRGTLYCRISNNPALYHDKVERDKFFANSSWLSVSNEVGCWICNSSKITERATKKAQLDQDEAKNFYSKGF